MYCKERNLRKDTIKNYEDKMKTVYKFIDYKTPIRYIDKNMIDNLVVKCKEELKVNGIT